MFTNLCSLSQHSKPSGSTNQRSNLTTTNNKFIKTIPMFRHTINQINGAIKEINILNLTIIKLDSTNNHRHLISKPCTNQRRQTISKRHINQRRHSTSNRCINSLHPRLIPSKQFTRQTRDNLSVDNNHPTTTCISLQQITLTININPSASLREAGNNLRLLQHQSRQHNQSHREDARRKTVVGIENVTNI